MADRTTSVGRGAHLRRGAVTHKEGSKNEGKKCKRLDARERHLWLEKTGKPEGGLVFEGGGHRFPCLGVGSTLPPACELSRSPSG
jgi:hypothetical protein